MSVLELINEVRTSGVTLSILPGGKLQVTGRPNIPTELKARLSVHKAELLAELTGAALAKVYRKYWTTPDKAPMETFTAILVEIGTLEGQLDPAKAVAILEAEAQRFHRERGVCPYCRFAGPLHHHGEPEGQDRLL